MANFAVSSEHLRVRTSLLISVSAAVSSRIDRTFSPHATRRFWLDPPETQFSLSRRMSFLLGASNSLCIV